MLLISDNTLGYKQKDVLQALYAECLRDVPRECFDVSDSSSSKWESNNVLWAENPYGYTDLVRGGSQLVY